jgi:hypothetical protein
MPAPLSTSTARRWLAISGLTLTTLAAPLTASAQAPVAPTVSRVSMSHPAAYRAYGLRRETLDQRIASLHAALRITPGQEADWSKVADVMRRNDSDMQKLVADRKALGSQELSAVDDLKTYQKFTQAHVDGLKDLIVSFETLYSAMPQDQRSIADHVFAKYGRDKAPRHSGAQAHG